jgi:hypothetical protein
MWGNHSSRDVFDRIFYYCHYAAASTPFSVSRQPSALASPATEWFPLLAGWLVLERGRLAQSASRHDPSTAAGDV